MTRAHIGLLTVASTVNSKAQKATTPIKEKIANDFTTTITIFLIFLSLLDLKRLLEFFVLFIYSVSSFGNRDYDALFYNNEKS
jgi:hypothetical protein